MPKTSPRTKRTRPVVPSRPPRPVEQTEAEAPRVPQQDRGQRRVEEILDAAERVVAEVGWDGATTQAIAERAGSSVGSLYHFFPTKDAILVALAGRYAKLMFDANERAMPPEAVWWPPEELFEGIIRAQVALKDNLPAFVPIYEAVERRFGHDQGPLCEMDEAIYERVRSFCAIRTPRVTGPEREASVRLMVGVVHRAMHESAHMPPGQQEAMYRAARDMLAGYLRDMDRKFGPIGARSAQGSPRPRGKA